MTHNNGRSEITPDESIYHALHIFETAALIGKYSPNTAIAMTENAAANFEHSAGELIYKKLETLGFTLEYMEDLTEAELIELAPDEMELIRNRIKDVGPLGASALSAQAYQTFREQGQTKND